MSTTVYVLTAIIVSRNCTLPDVSMTQDVTTPEPPEGA